MAAATEQGLLVETISPADQGGVADAVRANYEKRQAIYPLGGRTAMDYGIAPAQSGIGLDLSGLADIVDYTPRDMTILVQAGVRMAHLAKALAAEGQHLPLDVPRAEEATIGGVVATNWNGPRRYGHGTIRDYVIGIHAVDGRGVPFKGGGRVVKNVAGYDFCKLLCGSLGTLGVITQLALKVKPLPERSAVVFAESSDLATTEKLLSRLAQLDAPPAAIDVLAGSDWNLDLQIRNHALVVRVEGTEPEVAWLAERVQYELWFGGATAVRLLKSQEADALWSRQVEFADRDAGDAPDESPMALKIAVPPSAVTSIIADFLEFDAGAAIQAHAASGIIYVRFKKFSHADLTTTLIARFRPAAVKLGGSLVVLSSKLEGLTPHIVWGGSTEATVVMERVKQKFDPENILNPGRFAY